MRTAAAVIGLLLLLAVPAPAGPLESTVHDALRVEWTPTDRPGIDGFVYNDSTYRIGLVRLRVMTREEPGQPGEMLAWVYGNVPARGRCPFSVRVPRQREVVNVTVESFNLIAREETPQSP